MPRPPWTEKPAGCPPPIRPSKALGDERRLRILRRLASGDLYLTEIAERMGLSKPTISHHLAQLRAVGLVTITESGSLTYYTLHRDRIADTGVELTRLRGGSTQLPAPRCPTRPTCTPGAG